MPLEIHTHCLRDTRNDQLWEAYAEFQGRIGPTVQSYSRKSARTKARTAFEAENSTNANDDEDDMSGKCFAPGEWDGGYLGEQFEDLRAKDLIAEAFE